MQLYIESRTVFTVTEYSDAKKLLTCMAVAQRMDAAGWWEKVLVLPLACYHNRQCELYHTVASAVQLWAADNSD